MGWGGVGWGWGSADRHAGMSDGLLLNAESQRQGNREVTEKGAVQAGNRVVIQ